MRIYILSNSNIIKNNWLTKLEPLLVSTEKVHYMWSTEGGLLQVADQKIYRMRIKDVPVVKTLMGAFPITIDKSEFIREEECFQVPPQVYHEHIERKVYTITSTSVSSTKWIFEYINGALHDNYFQSSNEEVNHTELLQFLNIT
jgi:hypothetical protein